MVGDGQIAIVRHQRRHMQRPNANATQVGQTAGEADEIAVAVAIAVLHPRQPGLRARDAGAEASRARTW